MIVWEEWACEDIWSGLPVHGGLGLGTVYVESTYSLYTALMNFWYVSLDFFLTDKI